MQSLIAGISDNLVYFLIGVAVVVFLISRLQKWDELIYAVFSIVCFVAFIGYIVVTIPVIDLTLVAVTVAIMIAVDFFMGVRDAFRANEGAGPRA